MKNSKTESIKLNFAKAWASALENAPLLNIDLTSVVAIEYATELTASTEQKNDATRLQSAVDDVEFITLLEPVDISDCYELINPAIYTE